MTDDTPEPWTMVHHTPGPWKFDRLDGVMTPSGKRLLVDGVRLPTGNHPEIAEAEANARLIAAAPELLAACRMMFTTIKELDPAISKLDLDTRMRLYRAQDKLVFPLLKAIGRAS